MSTIVQIPAVPGGESNWVQRTQLDGVDYLLRFQWVQRDGHWLLSVADQDDVPIASGLKIVAGWPLLRRCVDARRPPGEIIAVDTLGLNDLDAGFADLGSRFQLLYESRR